MNELTQRRAPAGGFSRSLVLLAHRWILWFSKRWLVVFNVFFLLYAGLPFLAPILLAYGYTGAANAIYQFYHAACHQFPSRSYFIGGEQVAWCHRDVSIYTTILLGGLVYSLVRNKLKPLKLRWYVFFMVPIAMDAGMAMASEWMPVVPINMMWVIGLITMGLVSAILRSQNYLTWHSYLFFAFGPLSLIYLQFFGPHQSNVYLRTITGFIFGFGTIWFAYPYLETYFEKTGELVAAKLERASGRS
jgi:uncharacterized membrane protein